MSINSFTWHDLAAGVLMLALGAYFVVRHRRGPDRLVNVLFAAFLACSSLGSMNVFFMDNLVPAGNPAANNTLAQYLTTWLIQANYTVGILAMPIQLHFVVRYCQLRNLLARHIGWAYMVAVCLTPLVWLPSFARSRAVPLEFTSSWVCAVPWMPEVSPWSGAFVLIWLSVQVYTQIALWRYRRGEVGRVRFGLHASVVQLFLIVEAGGVVLSVLNGSLGYTGPDPHPVSALVAGGVLLAAIRSGRTQRSALRYQRLDSGGLPVR